MREIKFRAMTKPPKDFADYHFTSEMVYGTGLFNDPVNTWLCAHDPTQAMAFDMKKFIVNPETVGQFTGVKDKNGKEIYEGDIVQTYLLEMKHKGPILRIEYKDRSFAMVEDENDDGGCWYNIVEVIGNIHEKPELLA